MSLLSTLSQWLEYLWLGPFSRRRTHWKTDQKRPPYTEREVEQMIASQLLTVGGGSGWSRDDPVVLGNVPGVLAGREIVVILAQKLIGTSQFDWNRYKVVFEPLASAHEQGVLYGIVVTSHDGSSKEAWFEVHYMRAQTDGSDSSPT